MNENRVVVCFALISQRKREEDGEEEDWRDGVFRISCRVVGLNMNTKKEYGDVGNRTNERVTRLLVGEGESE